MVINHDILIPLQVIYARFRAPAHVTVMLFALFINIVIASMIMYEGSNILHALTLGKT
jgi:hypothetical protein